MTGCNAFVDLDEIELADAGADTGACDPVAQTGCPDKLACLLRVTDGLTAVCSAVGTTPRDATCDDSLECEPGTQCISWPAEYSVGRVCSQICEFGIGEVCRGSEQCINPIGEMLEEYGFCVM